MELDTQQQDGVRKPEACLNARQRAGGFDTSHFAIQRREDIEHQQDEVKTAEYQHDHPGAYLPDPQHRLEMRPKRRIGRARRNALAA